MLIDTYTVLRHITKPVTGVIHVGAHMLEELNFYRTFNHIRVPTIWIEANPETVHTATSKFPGEHIVQALLTDVIDKSYTFHITNNSYDNTTQSSSILELHTHLQHHPHVTEQKTIVLYSTTLDRLLEKYPESDRPLYNFLNLDIQGAELLCLKGATEQLKHIDYIYTEVNTEHLYKDCALMYELDEYLSTNGFSRVETKITEYNWGDALYIKK